MTDVIIIHGSYGSPEENWFPWIRAGLQKYGLWVHIPRFPTPERQSLANWKRVFEKYERHADGGTVFIGHSVGCAFILSLLEELSRPVKASFLVAGWLGSLGIPEFDRVNATFAERQFDWERIRQNCREFRVYASDNDPYVPLDKSRELASKLGTELRLVKSAGHFNRVSGYSRFDVLLEDVLDAVQ